MSTSKETVIYRFWSRVFSTPDKPCVLVKNPNAAPQSFPIASPMGVHVVHTPATHYVSLSWRDCGKRVAALMVYLREAGFKRGDRAAILCWNSHEWALCDLAIQGLGGITVPIYPNSGGEQVAYVLKDSGSTFIFSSETAQLDKVAADSGVRKVLFAEALPANAFMLTDEPKALLPVLDLKQKLDAELTRLEKEIAGGPGGFLGVSYDDVATLIYTSGSTGVPKGVVLTHGNFACECESVKRRGIVLTENDRALSYLPLAHVYERVNGQAVAIWNGLPVAYCRVEEVGEAVKEVRPTILLGVPAVWRKMKDKIQGQLDAATGLKAKLIRWAFAQQKPGFKRWLADRLVFAKIREGLGGQLRILMSGGAPISPEILNFFNQVGLTLLQGYGLTETSGGLSVNTPDGNKVGSVGRVIDCVEVKIVPEAGSTAANEGEIWVRGATVFKGYWNLTEETAKSLDNAGWFKTGDLGRLDGDGYLYITGRKKRLLKTDGGKYVAPEKIEKALDGDPLVAFVVPVGDGKPFISGLVFLNELTARELLQKAGVTAGASVTVAQLYGTQPEVKRLIDSAVSAAIEKANAKLERWEQLKKFKVVPVEATVAGGLLTATLKIRTEEVLKRYQPLVDELYNKSA